MKTKKMFNVLKHSIILLCSVLFMAGSCDKDDDDILPPEEEEVVEEEEEVVPEEEEVVPEEDFITGTQDITFANAVTIAFTSGTVQVVNPYESQGVQVVVVNQDVTVTSTVTNTELNYVLSGITSEGSFKLYGEYRFGLVLNGVSIQNSDGAAINIQSGQNVSVTLVDKTSNRLIDGSSYKTTTGEDMKGTFFSEGQLLFDGAGSLLVYGNCKHAICSDDYIRINSGAITVNNAASDGIHVNNYFLMEGGTLTVNTSKDGVDCEKGYITVNNGTIDITSKGNGGKGLKSTGDMTLAGGTIKLTGTGSAYYDADDADISSPSGVKCDGNCVISGSCALTITSSGAAGKGISTDGSLTFNGGTTTVTTSGGKFVYGTNDSAAKAIKSDGDLTVNSGTIIIKTSKEEAEGLESKATLTINGGNVQIEAYDDCINATKHIEITGGNIYCYSETNDGIDSNGTLTVSGGVVVTSGAKSPEEGFDCDQNTFKITGGTLLGIGGATSTPTASVCTQRTLIYAPTTASVQMIHIETAAGVEVMTFKMPRTYTGQMTMLFSSSSLKADTSYKIYTGGSVSGGTNFHGLYTGGTYTGGTTSESFTPSAMVTTVGNTGGRP